jgi:hypothetical protein
VALQRRYEAVWEHVIAKLHRSGDWTMPTHVDRLLMFGALNWIAHWYRPQGRLAVADLAEEASRFFLRTPEPRDAVTPSRRPRSSSQRLRRRP